MDEADKVCGAIQLKLKDLLDLSASPHISLRPVRSNVELIRPASASREPGWAVVSRDWKR